MSRKKTKGAESPDSNPFRGPPSMRGTKFMDSHAITILATMEQRQKSCLPFVSWETSIQTDDEELARGIPYPREAPPDRPDVLTGPEALRSAIRDAIRRLKVTDFPRVMGVKKGDLPGMFPLPKGLGNVNPAFVVPFRILNLKDEKLLKLADVHVRQDVYGSLVHLIRSRNARWRFTGLGGELRGHDPRLVAWRSWFDFQNGRAPRPDYLMDLRSFVWLSLQQELPYDDYVIGGTVTQQGDERNVLHATRTHQGWFVDEYRGQQDAAVLLMS